MCGSQLLAVLSGGEVALCSRCGTAWHGLARHDAPWDALDLSGQTVDPRVSMGAAEPEQTQLGWMRPAPAPRSDREAPASGMNSQSKTRQPESTTP